MFFLKLFCRFFGLLIWLWCLNEAVGRIKMYGVRICLIDVTLLFFSTLHTFRKMKIYITLTVGSSWNFNSWSL